MFGGALPRLREADVSVRPVLRDVQGHLLKKLAVQAGYHDVDAVDLLRDGAPLIGNLAFSGGSFTTLSVCRHVSGVNAVLLLSGCGRRLPVPDATERKIAAMLAQRAVSNAALVKSLKEDPHAEELHKLWQDDFALGRMGKLYRVQDCDLSTMTLSPRFCVEQGVKADGAPKLRPIDDFSRSGCNAVTFPAEKLVYESLDSFTAALRRAHGRLGCKMGLWKADIDSAYRRIPVHPAHGQHGWIVFLLHGQAWASQHKGLPFGSVASVHHWNRVGALLCALARRLLHIPVSRYVDDFFAMDREGEAGHAMQIFARLVRCLLGHGALAERKLEVGMPLVILGIRVVLADGGVSMSPDKAKVRKWCDIIRSFLTSGHVCAGEASKLAGRLNWASQACFKRLGRAMLYPIYRQQRSSKRDMAADLRLALCWWLEALQLNLCQVRAWVPAVTRMAHLLCDARSTPPRIAAVLILDGQTFYSDMEPEPEVMHLFQRRGDGQIMSLELLSIAFGMDTFAEQLQGRNLHVHSDNTGAQHTTERGVAKSFDHTCLIHGIWYLLPSYWLCLVCGLALVRFFVVVRMRALELGLGLFVSRVPTKDNLSDCPSREEYNLLARLHARWVFPQLSSHFRNPQTWDALSVVERNLVHALTASAAGAS